MVGPTAEPYLKGFYIPIVLWSRQVVHGVPKRLDVSLDSVGQTVVRCALAKELFGAVPSAERHTQPSPTAGVSC